MTCSPTCCPPGACAASPASSNARCPTLGSRRALTATGPSRPSHPPKPSPSDEPDPRQTHNATALGLDPDRPQLLPADPEVLAAPELEDRRQDALRHRRDGVVIGQHGVVVVLARVGG